MKKGYSRMPSLRHLRHRVTAFVLPEKNLTTFSLILLVEGAGFSPFYCSSSIPYSFRMLLISSLIRDSRLMRNSWASCCELPSKNGQCLSKTLLKGRVSMVEYWLDLDWE